MEFKYTLDFSKKNQKYLLINLDINLYSNQDEIEIIMPVWSPGSYLIREYSRYLDLFEVKNNITYQKVNKNTWKIFTKNLNQVSLSYRLYCNEFTVRTNFIDDNHALIVGPATFLIPKNKELCKRYELKINLPNDWKNISTSLHQLGENRFYSDDTDYFLDCPIEVGNYDTYYFEVLEKKHKLSIIGPKIYDEKRIISDIEKIVYTTSKIMKGIPYDNYNFILHLTSDSKGGLEHNNSCVLHFSRWDLNNQSKYKSKFLSLISHEYFHLWNAKRIKPLDLVNIDYSKENYTNLLWVVEGFTSYFDDLILKRAGIYSNSEYLEVLSNVFEIYLKNKGRFYESLEDSSFYTWIKYYRKHENTNNQSISYYVKGAIFAWALDMEILNSSNCKNSIEDLILMLWNDYLENNKFGYTREIINKYASKLANKDLSDMFIQFLDAKEEIDYNRYLNYAGLELIVNDSNSPSINCDLKFDVNKVLITTVIDKGAGYYAGLCNGDEIIAINGYRVTNNNFYSIINSFNVGDKINILVSRDERLKELELELNKDDFSKIRILDNPNKNQKQLNIYNNWLKTI
ncbi:MAG: peptidase M61 [Candidatus Sericytochromatia bacterium]|nr:MAG: peptidase M61 [Candidatus Sericytochromatia bacterium]